MSDYTTADIESTELSDRAVRALTEYMTVLETAPDVYGVTTQSGSEYTVDARDGRCTCPDAQYNLDDGEQCKHEFRVAYATAERAVPAWVNTDAVDVLDGCENEHCQRLLNYVHDPGVTIDALDYEDVFWPLRHHRQDGLTVRLSKAGVVVLELQYGAGDFIYHADDDTRTIETALKPFVLWEIMQEGILAVEVTVIEP